MLQPDQFEDVLPWRPAVAGDFIRLTGYAFSQPIYTGLVVQVKRTTDVDLYFDRPVEDTTGTAEIFLYNREDRFSIVRRKGGSGLNPEFDCEVCGRPLDPNGICINIDCTKAQEQATRAAARDTAKATAAAASSSPNAFTSTGRVD